LLKKSLGSRREQAQVGSKFGRERLGKLERAEGNA
jgi:hypothetical protein